jgi:hypothetical protein
MDFFYYRRWGSLDAFGYKALMNGSVIAEFKTVIWDQAQVPCMAQLATAGPQLQGGAGRVGIHAAGEVAMRAIGDTGALSVIAKAK